MAEPRTLPDLFALWRKATPTPALIDARGGREVRIPAPAVARRVAGLAQGLAARGVGAGDRVALLMDNRPEWHIVDMALQHLGALNVAVYTTLLPPQIAVILSDSGARALVVDSPEQLAKILEIRGELPALQELILIDGTPPPGVTPFAEVVRDVDDAEADRFLEERRAAVEPGAMATLIYTSGTTGTPKGAILTQDNFVFDAVAGASFEPWNPGEAEVALSFLPLSHVLERLVDYIYFYEKLSIAYCGVLELGEALGRVRPHVFTAVPRVYEKIYDRIFEEVGHAPRLKRALFHRAVDVALKSRRSGHRGLAYALYDTLVYRKLRAAFGGRVRFSISGGAPLAVFVGEFFHAVGVNVLEGYGLTETSPVISVNRYERPRLGTVGEVLPGVEVRFGPDGEIFTRGRHVMRGYWNKPDETAAVLDGEGWFATGDIGEMDPDGYLRITDRKKDLIVTAGGKNVAPQPIENDLKASPLIENAVLFGDKKPFIVALVVPAFEELERRAAAAGVAATDREVLVEEPRVLALYQKLIDEVNAGLARYETIKKFRLVPVPFTQDGGELTPTLKVKRRVVEKRYAGLLDEMYSEPRDAGRESGHE